MTIYSNNQIILVLVYNNQINVSKEIRIPNLTSLFLKKIYLFEKITMKEQAVTRYS